MILASASPRRREILALMDIVFSVCPAQSECDIDMSLPPEEAVMRVAEGKAKEVFELNPLETVIGADTSVWLDNTPLGKPKDENEAFSMLKRLSGRTHKVLTGVSVMKKNRKVSFTDVAEVEFISLSDEEIRAYIATGEPMDKAGAYGVQGRGAKFVKRINGDFYTVMGLPCARLYEVLKNF